MNSTFRAIGPPVFIFVVYTKTIIHLSVGESIHHYSPPLRRITVNCFPMRRVIHVSHRIRLSLIVYSSTSQKNVFKYPALLINIFILKFSPGQTYDHNISRQHSCWAQHVAFGHYVATCYDALRHVGCCWLKFEDGQIFHATFCACCMMLRSFGQVRATMLRKGHAH